MSYLRLTIEPIPAGSRLASLAKLLPSGQWSRIRHEVYRKAGFRCQICGDEGRRQEGIGFSGRTWDSPSSDIDVYVGPQGGSAGQVPPK